MAIVVIENNNRVIRVREEECGCVFFFDSVYVEGNAQTFYILKLIADGMSCQEIVKHLLEKFDVAKKDLLNDLIELFLPFQPYELFLDYIDEFQKIKGESYDESA